MTLDGEREFVLHRQELLLQGRGVICFGHSYDADPVEAVSLTCIEDGAFPSS